MKALKLISILLISCSLFTGCDFVRSIFGMPTSEDLLRLKLAQQEKEAKLLDSAVVDIIENKIDSSEQSAILATQHIVATTNSNVAVQEEVSIENLDKLYYVVLGLFEVPQNADNLTTKLKEHGYDALKVLRKSGKVMVLTSGTNNYDEAISKRQELLLLPFCPTDATIYDNTKNIHK